MSEDRREDNRALSASAASGERRRGGSLRDALAAAARTGAPGAPGAASDTSAPRTMKVATPPPLTLAGPSEPKVPPHKEPATAAEAARAARGEPPAQAPRVRIEPDEPQTRVERAPAPKPPELPPVDVVRTSDVPRTQLVRGKTKIKRMEFHQDPVVGWLVVVGGAGLGAFRPIFEGNNTVGRAGSQRIPIDFGDEAISSEEQAYIRYDSVDRKFLLVPNLAKTNIVAVNERKPTGAVELAPMDLITMGRTQLVFVPFCGNEFDWSELTETKD